MDIRDCVVELYPACPGCGLPVSVGDNLHHALIRRDKHHPELDELPNRILVHQDCHVPEAEGMRYNSYVMILRVFGSAVVESWVRSLPFKITPTLPDEYYAARMEVEGR